MGASLTFTGAVPANVHANGLIVGVDQSALKVVAADASSAKVSGLDVDALLDSVFSSLNNRATGDSAPLDPLGYSAERRGAEAFAFLDESQSLAQPSAWLKLFGGVSKLELPTGVQASSQMGGLIAGIEMPLTQLDTAGFFLGGATGSTSAGSADITQNSGFAGFYSEHHFDQYALDMALVLGGTHYSGVRSVIDNTLPGGVTTANADYNGFFVSPELGLSRDFDLGGQALEVRGSLQYAGMFLEGYSETGPGGSLTIDPRSVHQLTAKVSLATPFLLHSDAGTITRLTPRIGIDGSTQYGDQVVTGSLAGTPVSFNASSGPALTLSAGAQLEHRVADRWSIIGDLEGTGSPSKLLGAQASLQFKLNF